MKKIEELAFLKCKSLQRVVFEEGSEFRELYGNVFSGCTSLKEVILPEGLESIGEECF